MKKVIALCLAALMLVSLSSCQQTQTESQLSNPSGIAFELKRRMGSDLDTAILPETFQKIGTTAYTLPMLQYVFGSSFSCNEEHSIQTHIDYPALADTEKDLLKKLKNGEIELAFIEKNAKDTYFDEELEYTLVGRESFLLLTSDENPVKTITAGQLQDVLDGKITNWKQLGGKDGKILLLGENQYEPDRSLFKKLFMKENQELHSNLTEEEFDTLFPYGVNDPSASGADYCATTDYVVEFMTYYRLAVGWSIDNTRFVDIHQITIDGSKVSSEAIQNETTPYLLKTYAVTKKSGVSDPIQKFLYWFITGCDTGISAYARMGQGLGALEDGSLNDYLPKDKF